jgi:acetyl esterase/lipase
MQFSTRFCKYIPYPGLSIENKSVPNKFREKAHQFLRAYFEGKYGNYPLESRYYWNMSKPLDFQWIQPKNRTILDDQPVLYYIHGGSWFLMHSCLMNHIFSDLTEPSSSRVMSLDFRLGPQYPLLSILEDVFAGYYFLIGSIDEGGAGLKSSQVVISGDSSGGESASALMHILRNANQLNVAGAVLISPANDVTFTQPSVLSNSKVDYLWDMNTPVTINTNGLVVKSNLYYQLYNQSSPDIIIRMKNDGFPLGPREIILWPEISPLFDPNMKDLPPTIIFVGNRDSVRDVGLYYGKLRAEAEKKSSNKTNIIPNIQTYNFDDMPHDFPTLLPTKYSLKALKTAGEFIYQALHYFDKSAIDSYNYKYIPDYKKSYMNSTYNMYWNNIQNEYSPWNSTYTFAPFPTIANFSTLATLSS